MKKAFPWFYIFFALIWILAMIPVLVSPPEAGLWTWSALLRYAGLAGFGMVFLSLLGAYIKEWQYQQTKKPFIESHHLLVRTGWVLMLLHPLALVFQTGRWQIFLPLYDSFQTFLRMGGKVALIVFTVGVLVAVLRKYLKGWKIVHMLQLIAFLLAGIHAWLIGSDFKTLPAQIILALMMASPLLLFFKNTKRFKYLLKN